jgi:hypothetical protein
MHKDEAVDSEFASLSNLDEKTFLNYVICEYIKTFPYSMVFQIKPNDKEQCLVSLIIIVDSIDIVQYVWNELILIASEVKESSTGFLMQHFNVVAGLVQEQSNNLHKVGSTMILSGNSKKTLLPNYDRYIDTVIINDSVRLPGQTIVSAKPRSVISAYLRSSNTGFIYSLTTGHGLPNKPIQVFTKTLSNKNKNIEQTPHLEHENEIYLENKLFIYIDSVWPRAKQGDSSFIIRYSPSAVYDWEKNDKLHQHTKPVSCQSDVALFRVNKSIYQYHPQLFIKSEQALRLPRPQEYFGVIQSEDGNFKLDVIGFSHTCTTENNDDIYHVTYVAKNCANSLHKPISGDSGTPFYRIDKKNQKYLHSFYISDLTDTENHDSQFNGLCFLTPCHFALKQAKRLLKDETLTYVCELKSTPTCQIS